MGNTIQRQQSQRRQRTIQPIQTIQRHGSTTKPRTTTTIL